MRARRNAVSERPRPSPSASPCDVCEQVIDLEHAQEATIRAQLCGWVKYGWCPGCLQEIPKPWGRIFKVRWRTRARERAHAEMHYFKQEDVTVLAASPRDVAGGSIAEIYRVPWHRRSWPGPSRKILGRR